MLNFAIPLLTGVVLSLYLDLSWIELCLLLALWPFRKHIARSPWIGRAEKMCADIAARRTLSIALAFVAPIALRLAFLPWDPIPQPWVPDEFSHLLIADTLLNGRLANPTHPLWRHFETIHVFFQPTYASPYFPGPGALLALGSLLGNDWFGVLLGSGAMCAALLWMLYGFLPEPWALVGGALAVVRWGAMSYWVNSYWGGALAAAGGALVVGAYARIRTGPKWRYGWAMGAGLVILFFSRPLEGAVTMLPLAVALALLLGRPQKRALLTRVAVPVTCLLAIGFTSLGIYDRAVTGNALRVPYRVNQALYGWPMTLPWEHPPRVTEPNREMALYAAYEQCSHRVKSHPWIALQYSAVNLSPCWRFFLGPALTLPLLWAKRWWTDRSIRIAVICSAVACALGFVLGAYPHYLAPATGCFLIVIVQALRRAREVRQIVGLTCLLMLPVRALVDASRSPGTRPGNHAFAPHGTSEGRKRTRMLDRLQSVPGRHLVFVQYDRSEYLITEWVYNSADIDDQKVVWARDLGPDMDREVLRYYPDRRAWLVRVDDAPDTLLPYDPAIARKEAPPGPSLGCPGGP